MAIVHHVNWDEVTKQELIPEGRYPARIDKIEERPSKKGEVPSWNITFAITSDEAQGRKAFNTFGMAPNALWKFRELLEAIGVEASGEADLDSDDYLGQEVGIIITHEEYEGKLRTRIGQFYRL